MPENATIAALRAGSPAAPAGPSGPQALVFPWMTAQGSPLVMPTRSAPAPTPTPTPTGPIDDSNGPVNPFPWKSKQPKDPPIYGPDPIGPGPIEPVDDFRFPFSKRFPRFDPIEPQYSDPVEPQYFDPSEFLNVPQMAVDPMELQYFNIGQNPNPPQQTEFIPAPQTQPQSVELMNDSGSQLPAGMLPWMFDIPVPQELQQPEVIPAQQPQLAQPQSAELADESELLPWWMYERLMQ